MFSSIFGKRKSSPVEGDTPPIPGPKSDDGFVVINPAGPPGGMYPNISGVVAPSPYPLRPAPVAPLPRMNQGDHFHYLQGVPFNLSRELQMASGQDSLTTEVSNVLSFLTNKINLSSYEYDFSVEKSVLREC